MNETKAYSFDPISLQKSLAESYVDLAASHIKNNEYSGEQLKAITLDIVDNVKLTKNAEFMFQIAKKVEKWKTDETEKIKKELYSYSKSKECIVKSYIKKVSGNVEILVVIEDSSNMEILGINEFCYQLCDVYNCIQDFLVLDLEEVETMQLLDLNYTEIYRRG